jgi:hypothetical protein
MRALLIASLVLAACGSSGGGGGTTATSSSSGSPPSPPSDPQESFDAQGCPAADVVHFEKNGTELTTKTTAGGDPSKSPPGEGQLGVVSFLVATDASGNKAYEEVLFTLYPTQGQTAPSVRTNIGYRSYPPIPAGQTGVSPSDAASYGGTAITGTVTATTPDAQNAGDLICGSFDLTGTLAGEPTVRLHGVFKHQYLGPQPGTR